MEAKIRLVRQEVSHTQCVVEYQSTYSAAGPKYFAHTLKAAVFNIIKQHCVERKGIGLLTISGEAGEVS